MRRVTICACSSRKILDRQKIEALAGVLRRNQIEVDIIPDLCRMIADRSAELDSVADTVVACYPRAIAAMFQSCDRTIPSSFDIRNDSVERILKQMSLPTDGDEEIADAATAALLEHFPNNEGTDAWFPTIDRDRCVNCGKCLDFCLFGVYAKIGSRIVVQNPNNCKNNCPACSRICPRKAIIFPKYEHSPFNGGLAEEEVIKESDQAFYAAELRRRLELRKSKIKLLKDQQHDVE